ncbi:MAG: HK97 family phage prohead protease, partial [Pseudomonadota bacterium]
MSDRNTDAARTGLEAKFNRIALEDVSDDGTFEGYASLFGVPDQGGDVVAAGAFSASLAKRGAGHIRLLFQHDPAEPIGVWAEVREDERGLFVRGRLMPEVSRGAEVLALMRAGAVDGLSIGYRTVRSRRDGARGLRILTEVDL